MKLHRFSWICMCIGGSSGITNTIESVNKGEWNLKYADYKINTYKTEWNGLLTQLICQKNEWGLQSAINFDYIFMRPVSKTDQRNTTGKRDVGW
jgi:hypothetical protein